MSRDPKANTVLKKNKVESLTLPSFTTYYKCTVTKNSITVLYWYKYRHIDKCNRIESSETNFHTYGQMIFNKSAKNMERGEISLFNKWC